MFEDDKLYLTEDESMSGEKCDGCRFYHWWSTQYSGQCRRYPPKIVDRHAERWPNVGPDDWCGEFEPKVEGPAD